MLEVICIVILILVLFCCYYLINDRIKLVNKLKFAKDTWFEERDMRYAVERAFAKRVGINTNQANFISCSTYAQKVKLAQALNITGRAKLTALVNRYGNMSMEFDQFVILFEKQLDLDNFIEVLNNEIQMDEAI